MRIIIFVFVFTAGAVLAACNRSEAQRSNSKSAPIESVQQAFAYPLGKGAALTQKRDRADDWYNAQDFGVNDHLGEDWNKNSGGNTDCGEPVFAIADGRIVYAEHGGPGWGNVLIIEHARKDGSKVRSLYGHLSKIERSTGDVRLREKIGEVGNADGRYACHLHFEIRTEDCPMWNEPGPGYSPNRKGWIDPSDFIDKMRRD